MIIYRNIFDLVSELERRGVIFKVMDGTLQYIAAMGVMTTEIKEALKHHKKEVIRYLQVIQSAVY